MTTPTIRPLTSTLPHPSEREKPVRIAVMGAVVVALAVGALMLRTPAEPSAKPSVAAAQPPAPPPPAPLPAAEPPPAEPAPVATHAPAKKAAPVTTQARVAAPKAKVADAPRLVPATARKADAPAGDDDLAALANRGEKPAAPAPPPPPAPPAPPAGE